MRPIAEQSEQGHQRAVGCLAWLILAGYPPRRPPSPDPKGWGTATGSRRFQAKAGIRFSVSTARLNLSSTSSGGPRRSTWFSKPKPAHTEQACVRGKGFTPLDKVGLASH